MNSSQKRRFTCACAHNVRSHFHDETSVGLVQDGLVLQSTLKTMIGSFMMLTIMCVACNLHIDVEDTQKEATEITTQMRQSHTHRLHPPTPPTLHSSICLCSHLLVRSPNGFPGLSFNYSTCLFGLFLQGDTSC